MVSWAHKLLAEVLQTGDLAVDLTAGNGHDTLFLWEKVGTTGTVLSFDIQEEALVATTERLNAVGASVFRDGREPSSASGVHLIHADHAAVADYPTASPKAVIANLGFLPGGDVALVTRPESTLSALQILCDRLAVGGRIAIVVYIGHPGGRDEAQMLDKFCTELPPERWQTLRMVTLNRTDAPWLAVLEKR